MQLKSLIHYPKDYDSDSIKKWLSQLIKLVVMLNLLYTPMLIMIHGPRHIKTKKNMIGY